MSSLLVMAVAVTARWSAGPAARFARGAPGELKAISTPGNAPATVVLADQGKKSAAMEVSERVNRGEQVLVLDLLFFGDNSRRQMNSRTRGYRPR